jgi:hypothetical protein
MGRRRGEDGAVVEEYEHQGQYGGVGQTLEEQLNASGKKDHHNFYANVSLVLCAQDGANEPQPDKGVSRKLFGPRDRVVETISAGNIGEGGHRHQHQEGSSYDLLEVPQRES